MSKYLFGFTEKTTEPADSELLVGGTGTASDYTFRWSNLALWIKNKLFGTSTVWTSDNDGTGSGLDADTLRNETPATLRDRALHTGDAPSVNISIDTNPLTDKTITNVQLLAQKVDSNPADYIPQGEINVAADFPLLSAVVPGWLYSIGTNVTDNDVTKTNTGQSFLAGVSIVWAADGSWLDLGSNYVTQAQKDKIDLGANFVGHINLLSAAITPFEGAAVTPDEDGVYPNYGGLERKNEVCDFVYKSGTWVKRVFTDIPSRTSVKNLAPDEGFNYFPDLSSQKSWRDLFFSSTNSVSNGVLTLDTFSVNQTISTNVTGNNVPLINEDFIFYARIYIPAGFSASAPFMQVFVFHSGGSMCLLLRI